MHLRISAAVLCLLLLPSFLDAADLDSIPAEEARRYGERFAELAAKLDNPQVKITPDADHANGVHVPDKLGLIVVPQNGLRESEELAAQFRSDPGAPVAYLFASNLVPVVEGQQVDTGQLRTITLNSDNGEQHTLYVLLLAVRQLADDDYRLLGYGKGEKPVVNARFSEGTGPGPEPVAIEIKDPDEQTRQGDAVFTLFGKYQASFRVGHLAD